MVHIHSSAIHNILTQEKELFLQQCNGNQVAAYLAFYNSWLVYNTSLKIRGRSLSLEPANNTMLYYVELFPAIDEFHYIMLGYSFQHMQFTLLRSTFFPQDYASIIFQSLDRVINRTHNVIIQLEHAHAGLIVNCACILDLCNQMVF